MRVAVSIRTNPNIRCLIFLIDFTSVIFSNPAIAKYPEMVEKVGVTRIKKDEDITSR
jgi:hypothetical protein